MDKEIRLGRFDKWGYKNSFSKGELARELTYMNRDYDKLEQKVQKQKEVIDKAEKILNECKLLMTHEFDWEEQVGNALDILKEVLE